MMEDQTSREQLLEAFRGIASDKVCKRPSAVVARSSPKNLQPVVTELDLRVAQLPAPAIEYLRNAIPSVPNEVGEPEYDYVRWLDEVFTADSES